MPQAFSTNHSLGDTENQGSTILHSQDIKILIETLIQYKHRNIQVHKYSTNNTKAQKILTIRCEGIHTLLILKNSGFVLIQ